MTAWSINHSTLRPERSGRTQHYGFARALKDHDVSQSLVAPRAHYARGQTCRQVKGEAWARNSLGAVEWVWLATRTGQGSRADRLVPEMAFPGIFWACDAARVAVRLPVEHLPTSMNPSTHAAP